MSSPHHHTERVRVEYADTDMGGAAHAATIQLWAERAEHGLLRALGLRPEFPRRRVEIDYLAPAFYGDEIDVRIEVAATGTTSVTFDWCGVRDGTTCFTGRTVAVAVTDGAPASVPRVLSDYSGGRQDRS
ncbi:acyl-CoA thioesterase [Tsukamurella sputi]|uniref:Acyl-CoA thioesterase n=1 Tax=Tsukamurella sputi TaxID=2591848 RepID=A0A5C5RTZ4_9ACTN|nr:thioesterase family protein [Tsukamurella sputi]TWS26058.1 acyl-CoA thioesterase [Tsukamurella sputi]